MMVNKEDDMNRFICFALAPSPGLGINTSKATLASQLRSPWRKQSRAVRNSNSKLCIKKPMGVINVSTWCPSDRGHKNGNDLQPEASQQEKATGLFQSPGRGTIAFFGGHGVASFDQGGEDRSSDECSRGAEVGAPFPSIEQ
jgi:hypothetical protein